MPWRLLHATVAVEDQSFSRPAAAIRHVQSRQGQLGVNAIRERILNEIYQWSVENYALPTEEVKDDFYSVFK